MKKINKFCRIFSLVAGIILLAYWLTPTLREPFPNAPRIEKIAGAGTLKIREILHKNYENDVPAKTEIVEFFKKNAPEDELEELDGCANLDDEMLEILGACAARNFPAEKLGELTEKILSLAESQEILAILDDETDFTGTWDDTQKNDYKSDAILVALRRLSVLKIRQELARGNTNAAREHFSKFENSLRATVENPAANRWDFFIFQGEREIFLSRGGNEFLLAGTPVEPATIELLERTIDAFLAPKFVPAQLCKNQLLADRQFLKEQMKVQYESCPDFFAEFFANWMADLMPGYFSTDEKRLREFEADLRKHLPKWRETAESLREKFPQNSGN